MTDLSRRKVLALVPVTGVAMAFGAARLMSAREQGPELPRFERGQVLTARHMNDIVTRINLLSKEIAK